MLKMDPRPIIDALEDKAPFQIDENNNPSNLRDIDMDDDVEIVPKEDDDTNDKDDEEADAIDGAYGQEEYQGLLEEDDDNLYENDDDYFTDSLFMKLTLMTTLCVTLGNAFELVLLCV